ncbi:16S rRNA (cytosine(967)-C(5))-methyltransferase RsmB [Spiroplasma cantharicola]|uniref:16S rRNA (Cytosine967-C5)-methyltransferase n=1 Tax=Spiroplasma cantharicola TaxID=362837 RepID=A0A0M4JK85_9MOLU|nr:16S rRNA (cytosine(967)-C(5))-methyltransferase RsmB [Spiroplasma cantharicola]ALD66749.1 16S rRNA (cytosine967-C5)-methyltransferase [Spiroplasma cantharicola]
MSARKEALRILFEVFKNNKFSNKLLSNLKQTTAMSKEDIAFVFKLVYGTIQYKIYLEYVVNKIIDSNKTDLKIQILLWMNLYQLKFLKAKAYYVINEAVDIAKSINKNYSGLVNKVSKILEDENIWEVKIKNKQNVFPLENGFPFWLYKKIENDYSKEQAQQFILHSNIESKISLRLNTLKISLEDFEKKYFEKYKLEKSQLIEYFYLSNKNIINQEIFLEGYVTVQDQMSGYASYILAPKENSKVLDMCSAPGGKLTHLAQIMKNTGKIHAYELQENKIHLIKQNLSRLGVKNVILECKNALEIEEEKYDFILLDAPCSGYGVIRQKPEIKLKKYSEQENEELVLLQSKLLEKAYNCTNKGTEILYSTCTINKKENEEQINNFLLKHKDIEKIYEKVFFGNEYDNDGFYICKMKRI